MNSLARATAAGVVLLAAGACHTRRWGCVCMCVRDVLGAAPVADEQMRFSAGAVLPRVRSRGRSDVAEMAAAGREPAAVVCGALRWRPGAHAVASSPWPWGIARLPLAREGEGEGGQRERKGERRENREARIWCSMWAGCCLSPCLSLAPLSLALSLSFPRSLSHPSLVSALTCTHTTHLHKTRAHPPRQQKRNASPCRRALWCARVWR